MPPASTTPPVQTGGGVVGAMTTPAPVAVALGTEAPAEASDFPIVRNGLTFEKWPFRLDIPVEYQD